MQIPSVSGYRNLRRTSGHGAFIRWSFRSAHKERLYDAAETAYCQVGGHRTRVCIRIRSAGGCLYIVRGVLENLRNNKDVEGRYS